MESNVCDFDHLDDNVLPPPRKRLLAGFKKHNENSSDRLCASTSASPPTTPEVLCLKNLLTCNSSGGSVGSSLEEIAESSEKAAVAALKAAETARTAAEEKAAVAVRVNAAAKSALELVAALSDRASGKDRHAKMNKSKKQVMVNSLYNKHDEVENPETNEMEQKSHQAPYTPPSLYRHLPPSDSKTRKHEKPKVSLVTGKSMFPNEGFLEGVSLSTCNGKATLNTECSSHEVATDLEKEKRSKCLTKLISSNWTVEKDIVSHRRKARKQLMCMVENQVNLS